ncbi:type IV pilin N-terminal domain-containing protein [Methanogenium sp. S4BF]|uniref:type IV pilin N-terminal domain-containing protein n=1 Tax=Methanogenium sp. S4BF TaxID=1789226 RepID=UPI00241691DF|nr:type IV pilin N-terminal domain-containing protein [Methanogenium sp. S4BF]WFN35413.1 type IV pilin N-terminal domain-containing protein [Methanogenium sp. S4BF]
MNGMRTQMTNEDAVSETIGVVLLIGLTVVAITLVGVFLFSQPMAEELPAVDVLISNNVTLVLFQHNGGDSLNPGDFGVYVDGAAVPATALNFTSGGAWPWSTGETLTYTATGTVTPLEDHIRITYLDNSGIFRPAYVDDAGVAADLADVSSAPLPTLAPGGVPATPGPEVAGEIVAESVLRDSQIIAAFASLEQTAVVEGRYFNFTVVSPNSTVTIQGEAGARSLNTGDTLVIRTGKDEAAGNRISITGVGNTFFSLRFERVNVWINGALIPGGARDEVEIKSAWIPEYDNLESNLAFRLDPTYELYINGALDPRSGGATVITLLNVRPTDSGMFVINAWSPTDNENSVILAKADGI